MKKSGTTMSLHSLKGVLSLGATCLIFAYKGRPIIIMKRGIHTEVREGHEPYNLTTLIILIQTINIDGEAFPDRLADHEGHLVCGVQPPSSASPHTEHIAPE